MEMAAVGKKMTGEDLIGAGMFNEEVRRLLAEYGKRSASVIFVGAPGSGKTTILDWFIEEAYMPSDKIFVVQEYDELSALRDGVTFGHPASLCREGNGDTFPSGCACGPDVIVIGEAKSTSFCNALLHSGSGRRIASTVQALSAADAVDRMTSLVMSGSHGITYSQAKKAVCSLQTIVYMENFKVQEIIEITGYDDERDEAVFRTVYQNPGTAEE